MNDPDSFDKFMQNLRTNFNDNIAINKLGISIDKTSVLGIFLRQSFLDYAGRSSIQFAADIQQALNDYVHNRGISWISDYNTKRFLNHQAEKLETTGQCHFDPVTMNKFLNDVQKELPNLFATIEHVRYLNYFRTKEYSQALFHLHNSFDISLTEGVEMQYALLNLGIMEYKFGHIPSAILALNEALTVARLNNDDYCLQEVQYWIEACNNHQNETSFIQPEDDKYIYNLTKLAQVRQKLKNGGDFQDVIDSLNQSLCRIIENDIDDMNRSQFLTTCLAWKKYGSTILAETYLKLANGFGEDSIEDTEKTMLTEAAMLEASGDSERALSVIDNFINSYSDESELLTGWRQARARLVKLIKIKKRELDTKMEAIETDEPFIKLDSYSEDYFQWCHDQAQHLIFENELNQALELLIHVRNQMRKTRHGQLGFNLILQAMVHRAKQVPEEAVPCLKEAMEIGRRTFDTHTYYRANMMLADVYALSAPEKSMWMLERIFPRVLVMKSKYLTMELYYIYAVVLDKVSLLPDLKHKATKDVILDYIEKAEQGYYIRQARYAHILVFGG
ncbi:MAG: anaphase-promoting complex subunit 5-domain-containing protein [Benjaminiella poitrasii]|nr:MAG: anaphase-promoting complex subunit 5-domain-containing protein [Benjaminiella poitrasii]